MLMNSQSFLCYYLIFFQSQSILKLQVEELESSDEQVLTCFLLPQMPPRAESLGMFPFHPGIGQSSVRPQGFI